MYLLDTNHCSDILSRKNANVANKLSQLPRESSISINTIIYGELTLMVEKSERRPENLVLLNDFLRLVRIYTVDEGTAMIYGNLYAQIFKQFAPKDKAKRRKFSLKEIGIHNRDLWIASSAIQHDLIIVSSDSDFARMQEVKQLKIETWRNA
ncbi:type II toxin-antitoxin system VapC family toxin [Microcoleus sp. FACHB-1515]|uniref:type II toxin-antitoxin system VapC family toxin n=1 Tax=Cyanophyceae TaxID=3028117 RepID=UPI001682D608|nr:type II toxin-antitoxin system VapC family toxin [Microcoleus sp. FACHB-1515]MBD2091853.1 type II toxin-antitoxin system VapC family toxin [Microcoleus sp. FACHB-1515]